MSIPDMRHVWPEWKIEKQIGRGTYGTVWQAVRQTDAFTSRAAIKRISIPQDPCELESLRADGLDLNASRTYLKRIVDDFVNEIRLMESFKGIQNIVSIEDYKVIEHTDVLGWDIYIRMELLTPFSVYLCDKVMGEEEVIGLGIDICTALEYCARRNIIHRDIKPENIFVNSFGSFKLGDFGTARNMESLTGGLSQKGTFNYMAPEVISGNDYDARVDVYSLGLVLYRLLNGNRLPFLSEKQLLSPAERRSAFDRRIRGEQLPPPAAASEALSQVILKACAFDPADRYESAAQMRRALQAIALNRSPVFIQPPNPQPAPEAPRKKAAPIRVEAPEMVIHSGYNDLKKKTKPQPLTGKTFFANPWVRTFIAAALILLVFIGSGSLIGAYQTSPTDLEVTALPDKVQYAPGDILDTEGLILTATGRNGMAKTITDGYRCDISQLSQTGIQEVTVTYRGAEAKFHVAVGNVESLTIRSMPDKTVYEKGETLDTTGLALYLWENGKLTEVREGFSCWPTTISGEGTTTITVFYEDKTASFAVSTPGISGISIASLPDQTTYPGDCVLEAEGLSLEVRYTDGSSRTIYSGFSHSPHYLESTEGVYPVTVTYQGFTTTFPVTVSEIQGISVGALPVKLQYTVGDWLDTTGLSLMVHFANGTTVPVKNGFSVKPTHFYTTGEKVVTINYKGCRAHYDVEVLPDSKDTIEGFNFSNLNLQLDTSHYLDSTVGKNDRNEAVYWTLNITYDLSATLEQEYHRTQTFSWTNHYNTLRMIESHYQDAKDGITGISYGYTSPVYRHNGQYTLEVFLPDDPSLEGTQSVTLYMGEKSTTITFDLHYLGDYETGAGWSIQNIRYE